MTPAHHAPWHALLGPLPEGAVPRRQPVAPPEVLATPDGASVAGWEQLLLELSAGAAGLRVAMVILDGEQQLLSAADTVLYRSDIGGDPPEVEYLQASVGGRFEPDGSFRGTRWRSVTRERADAEDGEDATRLSSTPSEPSAEDVAGLRALVAEVVRRAPPRGDAEARARGEP